MLAKYFVPIVLGILFISGCSKTENLQPEIVLESYSEGPDEADGPYSDQFKVGLDDSSAQQDSKYTYLKAVEIYNDDIIVTTYAFPEASYNHGTDSITSTMDGITLQTMIVSGTDTETAKSMAETKKIELKQDKTVKEIKVEGEGTSYTVNYDHSINGTTYSKKLFIYATEIDDTYSLVTTIDIDTSKFGEEAMPVIEELMTIWPLG